jgi:ABC-2 type transport system ATP-binding protein
VLILDEPTAGLDQAQIRESRALIRELGRQHTILLSTHILPEVEMTCDRVIIISRGKVAASGMLEDMKDRDEPLEELYLRIVEGEALRA